VETSPATLRLAAAPRPADVPIKDIATALCHQYEPRRPGKPGGRHLRWQRPHYLAARLVERSSCAKYSTDALITYWINFINGCAFMRGRPPLDLKPGSRDHLRVAALLRGSKRRRL
jgi:hypothetical protein